MRDYVIITDSCSDLTQELANELNVRVIPLGLSIDENNYKHYLDYRELDVLKFYEMLRNGKMGKTTAANYMDVYDIFESELKENKDILYICFSSGLSSHYHSVTMVQKELAEEYPNNKIVVVDSLCASVGLGLLTYLAVREKNKGLNIEELRDFIESQKLKIFHTFMVDDLNFLKAGGRISAATALIGTALMFKPILKITDTGEIVMDTKARGRKAAIKHMVDKVKSECTEPDVIFISHGDCESDALRVKEEFEKIYDGVKIYVNYIGPVIGSHSGPGTLAIIYRSEGRE